MTRRRWILPGDSISSQERPVQVSPSSSVSINLALGEKVQKEMLREDPQTGEFAPALVELVFTVENGQERQKLEALEVYPEDDQVILSRRIVGGRGTARVNWSEYAGIRGARDRGDFN